VLVSFYGPRGARLSTDGRLLGDPALAISVKPAVFGYASKAAAGRNLVSVSPGASLRNIPKPLSGASQSKMVTVTRLTAILVLAFSAFAGQKAGNAELQQVQSIYLLPMGYSFDQYLANRLTELRGLQVVADPKKADAVFTDRIGASFEDRMDELFPPPAPPAEAAKKDEKKKDDSEARAKAEKPVRLSSFGRSRGTLFLVDAKSRRVLWSTYERPKNGAPAQLDQAAGRIAQRLQKDIKGK
jgi:hypothetical protein